MRKTGLFRFFIKGVALFCTLGSASASQPGQDSGLLSLVPPGAVIVAEIAHGAEPTLLVLTRNNTADLMDLESICGVDPTRTIGRTIFVAARDGQGLISEHSLLASGHFDARHIFKAAIENGAIQSEYLGIPVLSVRPLDRDKGISRNLRWLAFIDSQTVVFGTVPMVQEELNRYLARSPVDGSLIFKLSHLHLEDQSWCVLTPTAYNSEIVRRTLATLDPILGPDRADDGLIMGIHFGRRVEIEYEILPDSANADDRLQTQPEASQALRPDVSRLAPHLFPSDGATLHKVIRLSKKKYEEFIAQERAREQAHGARRPK